MLNKRIESLTSLLNFIENAPENQEIIDMDCNDHCEQLASLAEQVANGADLNEILPELERHMQYWGDCREEFIALVAVLKAEMAETLPEWPDEQNNPSSVLPNSTSD